MDYSSTLGAIFMETTKYTVIAEIPMVLVHWVMQGFVHQHVRSFWGVGVYRDLQHCMEHVGVSQPRTLLSRSCYTNSSSMLECRRRAANCCEVFI